MIDSGEHSYGINLQSSVSERTSEDGGNSDSRFHEVLHSVLQQESHDNLEI